MKLQEIYNQNPKTFVTRVNTELRRLITEQPDFVYNPLGGGIGLCTYKGPCQYNDGTTGPDCNGCIFGQALKALGWTDQEEISIKENIRCVVNDLIPNNNILFIPKWLAIQEGQDKGEPWGSLLQFLPKET